MSKRVLLVLLGLAGMVLAGGCTKSAAVSCGEFICPAGNACDPVHHLCVSEAQTTVCLEIGDGDRCLAGDLPGICDAGYCISGCGDGVVDATEACDDGNFQSHDGCSSTCTAEAGSWLEVADPWRGMLGHASAYLASKDVLVVFGGITDGTITNDQWERDASREWRRATPTTLPPARQSAAMAYDAVRDRIVLFGGRDSTSAALADTWEYDGITWEKKAPTLSPPARHSSRMVFDPVSERIVLFGGLDATTFRGDTWEYDGTTWIAKSPTTSPSARANFAFAWDEARDRAVLFGGATPPGFDAETWEYAAGQWTKITAGPFPGARVAPAFGFSEQRNSLVMFGGRIGSATASDLWDYSASGWSQLVTGAIIPTARANATFTRDPDNHVLVLVGESPANDDVWELVDRTWADTRPVMRPEPRTNVQLIHDAKRDETLVLGGTASGVHVADTWMFDDRWNVISRSQPAARTDYGAAYDRARDRIVVFGGLDVASVDTNTTFEYAGATRTWTQVSSATSPPARHHAQMAFDETLGVIVMTGGGAAHRDTWEFDGTTWREVTTANGPQATAVGMAYDRATQRTILYAEGQTYAYVDRVWTKLELDASPPPRNVPGFTYSPALRRIVMYGGIAASVFLDDMWVLDETGWRELAQSGIRPPGRAPTPFTAHGTGFLLYGGSSGFEDLGDTWAFAFRSDTPDEDCVDGADNDGDHHVDANDPDCE